jgi:hypothetical protein
VAGRAAPAVAALLVRTAAEARRSGLEPDRRLLPLLRGEVALWLKTARPDPALTLIARAPDEDATRKALADLQGPLTRALTPPGAAPGAVPRFQARRIAGVSALVLQLGPRSLIAYAVFDGKLVVSTSLPAIEAVRHRSGSLADSPSFRSVLDGRPDRVTSLLFLDFSQLLALFGGGSSLSTSPAYSAVLTDLRKVKALGSATSGGRHDTTTELTLLIP